MATEPKPTPEKQNSPTPDPEETCQNDADKNTSSPERDGFFKRVRRVLHEPVHPSEAQEIVIMPGEAGDGPAVTKKELDRE